MTPPAYLEIVDFLASGTTPRSIIDFQPSTETQEHARELLEASTSGSLMLETGIGVGVSY